MLLRRAFLDDDEISRFIDQTAVTAANDKLP
jgi:hypothetical protein